MKTKLLTALFVLPLLFVSCQKSELKELEYGQVSMRMTNENTSTAYEEINLDVQGIQVRIAGSTGGDWYKLQTRSGVYNMLALPNGMDALLVNEKVPSGAITAVRLNLGTNNSVRKNGVLYPMPMLNGENASQEYEVYGQIGSSDLKLMTVVDAPGSVIQSGQESYHLKPAVRVYRDR